MTVEEASRSKQVQAMKLYKKRIVGCTSAEKRVQAFERLLADYNLELPVIDPRERKLQKDVLSQFENDWKPLEMELKINITAARKLQTEISRMEEERHVLFECKENINIEQEVKELKASVAVRSRGRRGDIKSPLLDDDIELQGMQAEKKFYKYICGTIPDTQKIFFERMLYRVSRGNAFVRYLDITGEVVDEKTGDVRTEPVKVLDPRTGELITKSVFYIVTIGRGLKLSKLCDFFQASIYVVPQSMSAYEKRVADIKTAVSDRRAVLRTTKIQIRKLLRQISYDSESGSSMLIDWRSILRKEKLLCAALRKCHHVHTYVSLEGWIADDDLQALRDECDLASAGHKLPISFTVKSPEGKDAGDVGRPPTYFKTNSFTGVYQNIVNTYGVPRYKEVNPGLFTIVTFPFTFGVMYGDMGHGGTLFLVALYFLYNEQYYLDQQRRGKMGELMDYAFGSRYALILMGFFGFYCGSIYNDFISVPFQTFDSMWKEPANFTNTNQHYEYAGGGAHYPYGIDYNWYHRKNELTFFNSLKMKMSVMIGVTQMIFGIVLGVFNHIYFKDMTSLYYVWIPQMLFMICTFGYMNIMIIYKWCQDYSSNGLQPPSLIQTMIKMFLSPGAIDGDPLYSGQAGVQVFLILLAVLSVPVMLLVKPILEDRKNRAAHGDAAGNDYQADGDAKRSQSFSGSRDDGIPSFIDDEKVRIRKKTIFDANPLTNPQPNPRASLFSRHFFEFPLFSRFSAFV